MTEVPEAAVEATARVLLCDYESEYDADHLSWRDFADLARRGLEAAQAHLVPPAGPDLAAVRWRQGGSHLNNVWAEAGATGGKPGTPAGRMDTDELAARACADHNAMVDLDWLLSKGFRVSAASYVAFPPGRDGEMLFEVVVYDDEGEHVLTADCQPSLGAALAEARKQAEEGATP